jgi:hypothetical protein
MIPYVQEIRIGSSTIRIPDQGSNNEWFISYVQVISTGSSITKIPDPGFNKWFLMYRKYAMEVPQLRYQTQGLINDDSLCTGNNYCKFHNLDLDPGCN